MYCLSNKGYRLYTGSWYAGPQLVDMLNDHETDCFGIARQTQKGIPDIKSGPKKEEPSSTETSLQLSENITPYAVCHIYTGVISKET
jgi:hypothetical protein